MNYSWSHVTSYFRVKDTKRQGRIAHHHTDATVPHIVALLGFSFHVAKIRQVSEFCKRLGENFIKKGAEGSLPLRSGLFTFSLYFASWLIPKRPYPHATGRTNRRQKCCERGYYHLHRQLNHSLLLHTRIFVLPRKNTDEHRVFC